MTDIFLKVSNKLHESNLLLVSAESCTGGWVAKKMTDLPGSSKIFERGFVTYSNESKQEMLGVSQDTLQNFGAVSEQVVLEMVDGVFHNSYGSIAVAISGIAGPDGGSEDKPVGTVCFAWGIKDKQAIAETKYFHGDREQIRREAANYAVKGIIDLIDGKN